MYEEFWSDTPLELKDIRFILKIEQRELGGNIAPFLGVKTNQNENINRPYRGP